MNHQQLFLRYAYSCATVQRDYLQQISEDELATIKDMIRGVKEYDDAFVRARYPAAFERMERMMGLTEILDEETIDAYFLFAHNKAIDERDGNYSKLPDSICEFCKALVGNVAEVKEDKGNFWYKVTAYEDNQEIKQWVHGEFVRPLVVGDLVVVHQAVIVREIDEEYYLNLKQKYAA